MRRVLMLTAMSVVLLALPGGPGGVKAESGGDKGDPPRTAEQQQAETYCCRTCDPPKGGMVKCTNCQKKTALACEGDRPWKATCGVVKGQGEVASCK